MVLALTLLYNIKTLITMEENVNPQSAAPFPTLKQMRVDSHNALRGHWVNAVLCTLVFFIISGVVGAFASSSEQLPVLGVIGIALSLLILCPLGFGYNVAFLRHMRGEEDDDLVTRPFQAFKEYGRYLGTSLLMALFVFLWTLLLVVPGIIMSYAYALTPYIMHEHPELSASECIARSKQMMRGYKWKLFCLDLTFLGWVLLCILSLGIGFLWLQPYYECARVRFYDSVKEHVA